MSIEKKEEAKSGENTCCGTSEEQTTPEIEVRWSESADRDLEIGAEESTNRAVCRFNEDRKEQRFDEVVEPMLEKAVDQKLVDDGVLLHFEPEPGMLRSIVGFIDVERRCCPFFRFELTVEADDGPFELRIETPEGFDDRRFAEVVGT